MSKTPASERPASSRASTITNPAGKKTIESLMLEKGIILAEQLEKAKNIQAQTLERLEDIIVRLGFLSEKEILELWAAFLDTSVVDLTNIKVDAKILSLIPEYQAKQYKSIPYKREGNKLTIVMADPFDIMASDMIAFLTQCKLEVLIAPKSQIDLAIKQLYSWEGFSVTGEESFFNQPDEPRDPGTELARRTSEEGPVVQFLNAIFKQAILKRASDIHIEPREDILLIRFRIDGLLHDAMTGPKSLMAPLVSRVKILAYLDIAERRMPQDGRLKVKMDAKEVDFRVSTVPSLLGEKAVLRLLQRESAYELDNIGFLPDDLDRLKSALDEPYGMVLVTGPTGAGKTTTLFGMLKYFNSSQINIFTIENPVEYRMDGITQVQINEKIGLDFAQGLRAALRQDPDVILVGEIRDLETAEIAFRASLTGHKVLSTLHTNNAAATINRLINMGVPPYLLTAALRAVIAQKLLHRICPKCRTEYRPSQKTFQRLKLPPSKTMSAKFFKGTGCRDCNMTGAFGRLGVFETMVINSSIRDLIMESGTEMMIKRGARLGGMKTMREIALQRSFEGLTTLEEVLYSTPSDDEPIYSGIATGPGGGRSIIMPVAMPMMSSAAVIGQPTMEMPQASLAAGFDPNDPLTRQTMEKLEEEFLFFTDDELMARLQLPLVQLQEIALHIGVERTPEFFKKRYGRLPEDMPIDDLISVIRSIQEKQGRIPDFLFENESSAKALAKAMTSEAVRLLGERVSDPEKLPEFFTEDFCHECGLDLALDWSHGSRLALVELIFPGRYRPWQFGETEAWLASGELGQKVREALDWLMTTRLGCSRGDLPTMLNSEVMRDSGLGALLEKFGGSVFRLVQSAFPGVFMPWQFPEEESLIWFREDRQEIAQAAVKWLVESQLKLSPEAIPARVCLKDFHGAGLSKLLDLFNQNLFSVIDNAFPGKFKPWEFAEQGDLWRSSTALETARDAVEWLIQERLQWEPNAAVSQLTRRHFLQHGLGFMIGTLFNHSPLYALENSFEALKTNEIFQKSLIAFSQEVRDLNSKWASLAEKIAINQFGKARFKVSLPNLKVAPIIPENERIYYNASNQIEYVPQIIVTKLSAYDDYSDFANWVPYCDRLIYWVLSDDRTEPYLAPSHPKVKLIFAENLVSGLRNKGMLDVVEKIHTLRSGFERLLDRKAPSIG